MPTVIRMSCISATNAAVAIFHSNAIVRYSTITTTNAISASRALEEIWLPQVGPTNVVLIWLTLMPSSFASESCTCSVVPMLSGAVWACHCALLPTPTFCTVTVPPPPSWTAFSTWLMLAFGALTWKIDPPLKSTLKFSPRTIRAMMAMARMQPEIVYQSFCRLTKLTETSPRYSRPPTSPSRDIMPPLRWPAVSARCQAGPAGSPGGAPRNATGPVPRAAPDPGRTICAPGRRIWSGPAGSPSAW